MSDRCADEWHDYYRAFSYFSPEAVREGCHPRVMEQESSAQRAIVLVHGLTDSPHFMTAIAEFFFASLGYNVYLPLLQCHGLKQPNGMLGVNLEEWKANVGFAVDAAVARAVEVSIGGLSTGGALGFHSAVTNPKISGALYLFSGALGLAGGPFGLLGSLTERLLRLPYFEALDRGRPLIGTNPYRYSRMVLGAARELAELIATTGRLRRQFTPEAPFSKRVFAAHSEADWIASIAGIERLQKVADPARFTFFRLPKEAGVGHAELVLKAPIFAADAGEGDKALERANPHFDAMMSAIAAFHQS